MKKLTILLSFAVLFVFSAARSQSSQDGDAIFKKVAKVFTLNADGTMSSRINKEVKLLTHNAFHRFYGETFIVYNPEYQKLKIHSCYTIMKDGKKVITPSNAFNEVLPRFAANAPVYNKLREMVVTHTGLEVGATIILDYEIVTAKGYFPAFMGQEALYESSPVEDYSVTLKVPSASPLKYGLYNSPVKEETKIEGTSKVISWKFKDVPAYVGEGAQPKEASFLPTLEYTDAKDVKTASEFLMVQPCFKFQCNDKMKTAALKIREKYKNDDLRVALALQEMVVNDFSLYPVPLVNNGYKCHTPIEVWNSGGGTEMEKAMLLSALLASVNINAEPAVVISPNYNGEMLVLPAFESFLVKCSLSKTDDGTYLSVQSVDDLNRIMKLYNKNLWIFDNKMHGLLERARLMDNTIEMKSRLVFDTAMAAGGKIEIRLSGACSPYFDLVKDEKKANSLLKGPFGEPKHTTISSSAGKFSSIEMEIAKDSPARKQGNYFFLELPWCDKGISSMHLPELTEFRLNPFEIPFPVTENYSFEFTLPAGVNLVTQEINEKIENSAGKFVYTVKQSGNLVKITKSVRLAPSTREKDYYENLRFILNKWQAELYREVVLKR